jgi:hypothetical protein
MNTRQKHFADSVLLARFNDVILFTLADQKVFRDQPPTVAMLQISSTDVVPSPLPGGLLASYAAISALTRNTVPTPALFSRAMRRTPMPAASAEKYPRVAHTYIDDGDYAENSYDGELRFSPGLAPAEQGYDSRPRYETASFGGSRIKRPFIGEFLRFISCGLVIAGISAAAFAAQYGDPETVQTLKAIKKTLSVDLGIPLSLSTTSLSPSLRAFPSVHERSVLEEAPRPPTIAAEDDVQRQLDAIAGDVAGVRSLVQQLAGLQTKVAAQIAALKAANDALSDRTCGLLNRRH